MLDRKNELFKANEYLIEECRLSSPNGASLDLTNHFETIDIFENLFENFLTARVSLVEGINLAQHMPLMGQETVDITFFTPGFPKCKLSLMVDGISTRVSDKSQKMQRYTIELVSKSHFYDIQKRVSKAYEGKVSEIVEKIFKEYVSEDKVIVTEKTLDTHKFVIPNWKPFSAINWLSKRAISEKNLKVSNYRFFETIDANYFVSLSKLMENDTQQEYRFDPAGTVVQESGARDILRELKNIEAYTIKPSSERAEQMKRGMFSGRILTHDLIGKNVIEKKFNYNEHFEETPSIEKHKPISTAMGAVNSSDSSFLRVQPKHTYKYDDIRDNEKTEDFVLERNSLMTQLLFGQGLDLIVPGDSRRRVGDIVDVRLPSTEPVGTMKQWYDASVSGKYMITQIRHAITNKDYKLFLELRRDSAETPYPDTKTMNI